MNLQNLPVNARSIHLSLGFKLNLCCNSLDSGSIIKLRAIIDRASGQIDKLSGNLAYTSREENPIFVISIYKQDHKIDLMKSFQQTIVTTIAALYLFSISVNSVNAQEIGAQFFNEAHSFFSTHVSNGLVDYASIKKDDRLSQLIKQIQKANLSTADDQTIQAFYINAYNLHVIDKVISSYPIISVNNQSGFFDADKILVAEKEMTLNKLEKEALLARYKDPRYHFVLVCGAIGCPPITNFAYTPEKLEEQLNQQAKIALNNDNFIKVSNGSVELSEIFRWYAKDFGGSKLAVIEFINGFRTEPIDESSKIKYYNYDWNLNDAVTSNRADGTDETGTNDSRYIVSSTIPKGSFEFKLFNNLYSQQTGANGELQNRSSFFTTSLSALYGLNSRLNIGINTRFRKVRNNALPSSPFSVFGSDLQSNSRAGLTAIGPQVRWAAVPKWSNFSIQSSIVFPIGENLTGDPVSPYIDWDGITWNTQFFNDVSIGTKFSLFTELDLLIEDIGASSKGRINRVSTPATIIYSYVPTNQLTFYALGGFSPFWQSEFDYFTQCGLGTKYQITPNFEFELLYTAFSNKFLNETNGKAATFNLGIRVNLQ